MRSAITLRSESVVLDDQEPRVMVFNLPLATSFSQTPNGFVVTDSGVKYVGAPLTHRASLVVVTFSTGPVESGDVRLFSFVVTIDVASGANTYTYPFPFTVTYDSVLPLGDTSSVDINLLFNTDDLINVSVQALSPPPFGVVTLFSAVLSMES
jgi:hypothetical protein